MKKHDEMTLKIAEIVFEKGDQLIEQNKKKSAKIRHITYAISGLCAAIITGVGIWHFSSSFPKPGNDLNPPEIITATETTDKTNSTVLSTAPVITSTERSSVNKTTTSTTSKKTISSDKSTAINKVTSVPTEPTTSSVSNDVSNNASTEMASSAVADPTQTSSSMAAETAKTAITVISTSLTVDTSEITESTKHNIITSTKPVPPQNITTETTTKRPTLEEVVEFPTEGKFPIKFTVIDEASKEVVKGLDMELYTLDEYSVDANFIEKLAEWNTTDSETYSCELPYSFEDRNSYSAYGVVIKNMPEGYVYTFSGENSKCFPVDYRPITIWTDIINGNDTHEHEFMIYIK